MNLSTQVNVNLKSLKGGNFWHLCLSSYRHSLAIFKEFSFSRRNQSATIIEQVVPEEESPKVRQVAQKVHQSLARQLGQLQALLLLLVPTWCRPPLGSRPEEHLLPISHAPSSSLRSRIMSSITAMHFFTLAVLCFILLGVHYGDAFDEYGVQLSFCPQECDCQGLTVDCARRGLAYLPKPLPEDVRRL